MAGKTFKLELITPSETAYSKDVISINAPGSEGYFGILPDHAPFVTSLAEGIVKIIEPDKTEVFMNVEEGFLEVLDNKVNLLVDKVEIGKTKK